jgi:hypothetical protein
VNGEKEKRRLLGVREMRGGKSRGGGFVLVQIVERAAGMCRIVNHLPILYLYNLTINTLLTLK